MARSALPQRRRRTPGARAPSLQPRWPDRFRSALANRRRGGRRARGLRRLLAVLLIVAAGVIALEPFGPPDARQAVVMMQRDLPTGHVLTAGDLALARHADVPDGALDDPAVLPGRVLAGGVRRGEVLTDVRLVPSQGPEAGIGRVAVPVRPTDPTILDLLMPGMHVAVLAVGEDGAATLLVEDAVVLAVSGSDDGGLGADAPGRSAVLSVPEEAADDVIGGALMGAVALRFT